MVYNYRRIPLTVLVHCYNINPAMLRNECRMKTNQRSRPVKKNKPVKDIYIIYIGRSARIVPRLFAVRPARQSGIAQLMGYDQPCIYWKRYALRDAHCVIYNVRYAMRDIQRVMYIMQCVLHDV